MFVAAFTAEKVFIAAFTVLVLYLTVWSEEMIVTHQTSWLESTGECGVTQNQTSRKGVHDTHGIIRAQQVTCCRPLSQQQ